MILIRITRNLQSSKQPADEKEKAAYFVSMKAASRKSIVAAAVNSIGPVG